jgi:tetratricopeptide (TPR) repeat protein
MSRLLSACLLIGLVVLAVSPAYAEDNPHFQKGLKLLDDMEDKKALKAFDRALERPGNTAKDRARIYYYMGVAHSNLFQQEAAKEQFKKALGDDPTIKPPEMTAPKIKALFEKARAEHLEETDRKMKAIMEEGEATPLPEPKPPPPPTSAPRDTSSANWPAWIALGVAVSSGVAGTVMAVQFNKANSEAGDLSVPYTEAKSQHDKATSTGLTASILFGVAGAAAVTSGVLFLLKWRRSERATASIVPLPRGAMLQVAGTSW